MVKNMVLRCLQVFAIAFVLSCLTTLAMHESDNSASLLNNLTSATEPLRGTAVVTALPDVEIEKADGRWTSFAATSGKVRIATAARRALDQQ
jgi:hypothetical protein